MPCNKVEIDIGGDLVTLTVENGKVTGISHGITRDPAECTANNAVVRRLYYKKVAQPRTYIIAYHVEFDGIKLNIFQKWDGSWAVALAYSLSPHDL